jgi:hypothetical protein
MPKLDNKSWALKKFDLRYGHRLVLTIPKLHFTSKAGGKMTRQDAHLLNISSKKLKKHKDNQDVEGKYNVSI